MWRSHDHGWLPGCLAATVLLVIGANEGASPAPEAGASTAMPFEAKDDRVRELWRRGHQLELQGSFDASSRLYEEVVLLQPEVAHPYWRIARNHMWLAFHIPIADEEARGSRYRLVEDWAQRGARVDESCGECFLYQFLGLSSATRLKGTLSSARHASEMGDLLERALALEPDFADGPRNSELANLYFAAGVFYKVVPDSALARFTLGVRGDPVLSREYFRKAVDLCDTRVDYLISLGASLLCEGERKDDPALVSEGMALLKKIRSVDDYFARDAIYREHAEILIAEPDRACDYSGEKWRRAEGR